MLKLGILGAGHIAEKLAGVYNFLRNDIEPYAVASRTIEKAQAIADKFNFRKAYGSYDEILSDPEVDVVYVATPHSHHYEHMLMCIEHGKHILCEKPFTVNERQAKIIFEKAKERGLFVCEAMWTRFMPCVKRIREILSSGELGEPRYIEASFCVPISWKERMALPELAGGALLDLGIYPLNYAMLYFGETPVKITSTAALTEKGVDEHSSFTLQYADGRIAMLGTSMTAFGGAPARIACTKGCIICEKLLQCEEIIIDNGKGVVRKENFPFDYNGYEYEIRSVIKAIEAGKSETEETPWSTTLNELRIMDTLRAQWGVKYPFE